MVIMMMMMMGFFFSLLLGSLLIPRRRRLALPLRGRRARLAEAGRARCGSAAGARALALQRRYRETCSNRSVSILARGFPTADIAAAVAVRSCPYLAGSAPTPSPALVVGNYFQGRHLTALRVSCTHTDSASLSWGFVADLHPGRLRGTGRERVHTAGWHIP